MDLVYGLTNCKCGARTAYKLIDDKASALRCVKLIETESDDPLYDDHGDHDWYPFAFYKVKTEPLTEEQRLKSRKSLLPDIVESLRKETEEAHEEFPHEELKECLGLFERLQERLSSGPKV